MSGFINTKRLRELADAYVMYEIATHGVDPRETLDGTILRNTSTAGEGYKYGVYEKYHEKMLTTKSHVDSLLEAMPGGNLASYHQKKVIEDRIKADGPEQLEEALTLLYKGDDDPAAFQEIVDAVGGYFDILGFVFFLKDCEQYMPIRSRKFDEKFKVLGLASDLEGNCTWEKYQEYNAWIKEIQSFLRSRINKEFTMIDAHSFVWVLPGIAEYLDSKEQIVEHKKYGKGIVTNIREDGTIVVHFGKEERMFMADAFDNGFLTIVPNDFNIYGDDNSDEGSSKDEDLKQHTSLNSLLQKSGIDLERTKLIRHAKSDPGFNKCLEKGFEFEYTRIQRKENFKGADTWVVFISGEGTTAIFDGCYHVTGDHPNTPDVMPDGFPVPEMFNGQYSYFDLEPIHSLDQYKGKLVIEWGKAARTWDQWTKNDKEIIAIHEEPITKTDDEGTTASKGTASGSTHAVGKYDSWTIKSENIAVKHCDKSFFEYRGSGVPREIYWFFGVEDLSAGAKKEIKLLYNDKEYEAYLQREIHELQRIRVFWQQTLADEFEEYNVPGKYPSLEFDKINDSLYRVSFVEGTALSKKAIEVGEALLKLIANRTRLTTYGELSDMTESKPSPYYEMRMLLDAINKRCDKLGLPYISAMVVNKGTGLPGEGFRDLCINSFGYDPKMTTQEIFDAELDKIGKCDEWYKLADFLGVAMPVEDEEPLPEEVEEEPGEPIIEGAKKTITVNSYERDPKAKKICKDYYMKRDGRITCQICGFDFGKVYGPEYANKIHVHHIVPVSEIGEEYIVDPIKDLIPVCPNCHMILHAGKGISVEDLKKRLKNRAGQAEQE